MTSISSITVRYRYSSILQMRKLCGCFNLGCYNHRTFLTVLEAGSLELARFLWEPSSWVQIASFSSWPYVVESRESELILWPLFVRAPSWPAYLQWPYLLFMLPCWLSTVVLEKTLEYPLDCKEIKSVNPKGNQSWKLIGRTMLKLKLQYFGHLMQRTDSFEKTPMLGKIEGRRRGRQRMRWLAGITTQWTWVWVNSGSW